MAYFLSFFLWFFYSSFILYFCKKSYNESLLGSFCFLFFSFYYLSIRPIFLLTGVDIPIPAIQFNYDYWPDLLITNLLITFWIVAITLMARLASQKYRKNKIPYKLGYVNQKVLFWLSLTLSILGFLITLYFIIKYGGVGNFLHQVKAQKAMAGLYVFREVSGWAMFLSGYLFLLSNRQKNRWLKNVAIFLILLNFAIIFSWGNRTIIGFFIFLLFVLYYKRIASINIKSLILVITLVVFVGVGLRVLRDNINSEVTGYDYSHTDEMSTATALSLSMHWSEYDGLMLAMRDVDRKFEFRYGKDFMNGLTAWVPRFVWPSKPSSHKVGLWFRQVYQSEKANGWPITALGNWYVNGGIVFVLIGIILTAIVISLLDSFSSYSLVRDYLILVVAIFVVHHGVDNNFIQKIFLTFSPLLLFFTWCRIKLSSH